MGLLMSAEGGAQDPASRAPADIAVSREQRELRIGWQDGHTSTYSFDLLRKECPCALCAEQRQEKPTPVPTLTVLTGPVVKAGEVQATEVKPIGRYAINFAWSDGHDSGIYSFDYLRSLCRCAECRAAASR
jgi:DUF971 family protein